jgi:hypothetical protein
LASGCTGTIFIGRVLNACFLPCSSNQRAACAMAVVLVLTCSGGAALAQSMALPGKFAVNGTGAATYSVPIAVPPGTAGLSPVLSLDYNSQLGSGLIGMGFSLSGLPVMARCARTMAQDGAHGSINYDANDRFCLDGQRLIAINGGGYGADGTEYRTEIESYTRVISHGHVGTGPAWFEVHTKAGQALEFGHTADSQLVVPTTLPNSGTVRFWGVNKVSDSKGNYYTVSYTNDATNGQTYPIEVDYTGNTSANVSPYNKVQLLYETRPDIIPQYQAGLLIRATVRLTNIKAYAGTTLVNDYRLTYEQSGPTNRSRLTTITACEGAGNCLPATTLTWSNVTPGFAAAQQWIADYGANFGFTDANTYPRFLVDVNGDGLPDVVALGGTNTNVSLNTGTSFTPRQSWSTQWGTGAGWTANSTHPRLLVDVNGDGLPDMVGFSTGGVLVGLNNGTSFMPLQLWVAGYGIDGGWIDNNTYPRFLVDVNGDGLPDVVGFASWGVVVSPNTGTSFAPMQNWNTSYGTNGGWIDNNTYPRFLVDVNGDGLPDVVGFASWGVVVSPNTGTSFAPMQNWNTNYGTNSGWSDNNTYPRYLVDVNGDGLPDVVGFSCCGVVVSLNTGTSFTPAQTWSTGYAVNSGWSNNNAYPRYLVDVNGDGLPDVVGFSCCGVVVSLNTGTGFAPSQQWIAGYGTSTHWTDNITPRMLVDTNGTGFAGVVGFSTAGVLVSPNTAIGLPDLVAAISSGFGTTTTITYVPATNKTVVTKGTGTAFPLLDLNGPLYVVSRVDTANGVGGIYSSTYGYTAGRLDTRGRGFLGFAQTSVSDQQTSVVQKTTYRQDFPLVGAIAETDKILGALTLNQTTNSFQFKNVNGTATINPASAPYQISMTQSVQQSADLDGTAMPAVTTNYQYDAFGNATQVTVSTPDGFSKTTVNTDTNDPTHWYLGRLTRAAVTSTTP